MTSHPHFLRHIAREDMRLKYIAIQWMAMYFNRVSSGGGPEETVLAGVDSLRLATTSSKLEVVNLELRRSCANLRESTPAGYSDPKSWDPEDQDEMDEIFYGYGTDLVMCTSGLWLYFILIPT